MAPLLRQGIVLLLLCVGVTVVLDGSVVTQRQSTGIVVEGSVTDASGAAIPGATITLQQAGQSRASAITTVDGKFTLWPLRPGTYTLVAALAGFKTASQPLTLVEEIPRLKLPPIRLQVGSLSEEVVVYAGATVAGTKAALFAPDQFHELARSRTNAESYSPIVANRFKRTADEPLSTFAADVDTASYTNVRRFLKNGSLPPADAVRIEELVNYIRFDYPQPAAGDPISITTEIGSCPWAPSHRLALVGLRARAIDDRRAPPRNIVLLIDVSGSMNSPDKLPLVKTGLRLFVDTLRDDDRVGIVVYAGASGLALPSTRARDREVIHAAIDQLSAAGSTNGADGIRLAYQVARQNFSDGGVNRVILATDGDFNVGTTSYDDLLQLIERERRSGVFLSVLGVGTGNLKDSTMEMLADKGNGNYAYLDSLFEAQRVLVSQGGATLDTVAKDVKLQVEFNPAMVHEWKLIGYENRLLAHQDFNDDRKDGGEMGAGHTVTALYELVPLDGGRQEWFNVKVRYKAPDGDRSAMLTQPAAPTRGGLRHLPLASAIAEFGLLLRNPRASVTQWMALVDRVAALDQRRSSDLADLVDLALGLLRAK